MPTNPGISEVIDKNGVTADIEAKRFDGTRTVNIQGDVTASQTWNGDSNTALTLNASIGAKKVTQDKIGDKAVGSGQMADGSVGLPQMDPNAITSSAIDGDDRLITSGGVRTEIDNAILNRGKDYGPMTPTQINAITGTIPTGSTVHVTEAGTITDGDIVVRAGEDLRYYSGNGEHYWYSLDGDFKLKQNAKSSPTASGNTLEFIDSITQDENGEITATKKAVQDGTTSQKGVVQLEDSHSSTSTTKAATPNSVKSAYDLANGKYSKPSGGIPKIDLASGVQESLDKADSALQSSDVAHTYTYSSEAPISGKGVTEKYLLKASSLTSSDDIDDLSGKMPVTVRGTRYLFQGSITVGGTFPGTKKSFQLSVLIQHEYLQYMTQELWYTDGYDEYHWVRKRINGTWQAWKIHWDTPTSTYSSSGLQPVNGQAVASAIIGKEDNSNKVTSWQATPDNTHYPSEKLVKDGLDAKADADNVVNDIAYVANQSGGGGNLNKTINGTSTSVLTFMNDSEAVAIWADAKTAAANA